MKFRVTPLSGLYSKILIMFYVAAIPEKGAKLRLPAASSQIYGLRDSIEGGQAMYHI